MKLIRVFPRQTNSSPDDPLAYFGPPPNGGTGLFGNIECDEVHISVTFTYDLQQAERLEKAWKQIAPVTIGGPATGQRGEEFIPGKYLKLGHTITSRGCNNSCWFCSVWKRDGAVRELPIKDGWIVQDDNLLSCSDSHIKAVFNMLRRQPQPAEFRGGFEAAKLQRWHIEELETVRVNQVFFAYDTADDYEPLLEASKLLADSSLINGHKLRCFILMGYPGDTIEAADKRCVDAVNLGFMPLAMLYKNEAGEQDKSWRKFQRTWANNFITGRKMKDMKTEAA